MQFYILNILKMKMKNPFEKVVREFKSKYTTTEKTIDLNLVKLLELEQETQIPHSKKVEDEVKEAE